MLCSCITIDTDDTQGLIDEELEERNWQYSREQCQHRCKGEKNCVQWDWREVYIESVDKTVFL